MTNDYGTAQPADGSQGSTAQAVREEASGVAQSAAESGQHLLHEAKSQARDVAQEAGRQVKDVLGQTRTGLADQVSTQHGRLAGGIRTFGSDLGSLADGSPQSGLASDLTRQLAGTVDGVASWLEAREPADLLEEVKSFARRSPGTFLAIAVGAGVLAGRLTRGAKDAAKDETTTAGYTGTPAYTTDTYATTGTGYGLTDTAVTTTGYETGATTGTYGSTTGTYGTTGTAGATYGTGPVYGTEAVDEGTGAHRAPGTATGEPLGGVTVEDGR